MPMNPFGAMAGAASAANPMGQQQRNIRAQNGPRIKQMMQPQGGIGPSPNAQGMQNMMQGAMPQKMNIPRPPVQPQGMPFQGGGFQPPGQMMPQGSMGPSPNGMQELLARMQQSNTGIAGQSGQVNDARRQMMMKRGFPQ